MNRLADRIDCWLKTYGLLIPVAGFGVLIGFVVDFKVDNRLFEDSFLVAVVIPLGTAIGTVWAAFAATNAARLTREDLNYQRERDSELKRPFLRVTEILHADGITIALLLTNLSERSVHIFHAKRTNLVGNASGQPYSLTLKSNESWPISFNWSFAASYIYEGENIGFCDVLFYYGASGPVVHRLRLPFSANETGISFQMVDQTITEEKLWGVLNVIDWPIDYMR